ncbi:hypothetical protein TcWFU_005402 [Taenia crassiceps]|uniref:Uncharacterized protein n=1 Tax=Taenia crassiceps TaxID=6207 RepID=A0ABR4Q314_9CEST
MRCEPRGRRAQLTKAKDAAVKWPTGAPPPLSRVHSDSGRCAEKAAANRVKVCSQRRSPVVDVTDVIEAGDWVTDTWGQEADTDTDTDTDTDIDTGTGTGAGAGTGIDTDTDTDTGSQTPACLSCLCSRPSKCSHDRMGGCVACVITLDHQDCAVTEEDVTVLGRTFISSQAWHIA